MQQNVIKYVLGFLVLCLALFLAFYSFYYLKDFSSVSNSIFALLVLAAAILLLPWQRISNLKAGGLELSLSPSLQSAVSSYEGLDDRSILRLVQSHEQVLPSIAGSRVLWIEDRPHNILGERRILRALGIDVTMAVPNILDPSPIYEIFKKDNDFDLIISDIQWRDSEDNPTYGGINLIQEIRAKYDNANIKSLPVIFYTAYTEESLARIRSDVRLQYNKDMHFCRSVEDLVHKVILSLFATREYPLKQGMKGAT